MIFNEDFNVLRGKNVQNSARFLTTSDFDRECLWNGSRYRQAENGVINYNPFHEEDLANFGPLTTKFVRLMFTHPKETLCVLYVNNAKSFPSHKAHRAALISVSLALSQTPVYTARPRIRGYGIAQCACLRPSFRWYSLHLPTKGWPGWVDLGGWLHTEMVYTPADSHPSK